MIAEERYLNFLFYGPITFGAIIVVISFFGCCGACCKSRCMLMTVSKISNFLYINCMSWEPNHIFLQFAVLLFIIFAFQVGLVYFVYEIFAEFNRSVNKKLMETIEYSKDNEVYHYIWEFIQYFVRSNSIYWTMNQSQIFLL